ncbi:MAG: GspE/PulE family protein [Planctomycetota bacterium]
MSDPQTESRTLETIIVEHGLAAPGQVAEALEDARARGEGLRETLSRSGLVSERDVAVCYAEYLNLPYIDLETYSIDKEVVASVDESLARRHEFVPLFKIGSSLTIAMVDPANVVATDAIQRETELEVDCMVSTRSGIRAALDQHYGQSGSMREVLDDLDVEEVVSAVPLDAGEGSESPDEVDQAPIIRLVNTIVLQAVQEGASDIHVSPEESRLRIRFRTDGVLHDVPAPAKSYHPGIVGRIKVLSDMDISESRKPQDGRFRMRIEGRLVDIRVSTIPTVRGENVVMRVLDCRAILRDLSELGLPDDVAADLRAVIRRPHGIMLVTGPTGSGKTVSLYAALRGINSDQKHIITVEDPVELWLEGIRQVQVNPRAGLTFSTGLRAILRHDPDVIMVGEIRDKETAETAVHASLTGHLVFSTLHTNDAPGAVTRLIDMGIEPFLVSASLTGVLAQRLVRVVCQRCKEAYDPPPGLIESTGLSDRRDEITFYHGRGCPACNRTGYRGRIGIFELLTMNEKLRQAVLDEPSEQHIYELARENGLRTLREDGVRKVVEGVTTLEEVARVAQAK